MAFRPLRRALARSPLVDTLGQAHRLYAGGQPREAALLLAQVAQAMENAAHPRRAANLHAQAAHAFADAGEEQAALGHARTALRQFLQFGLAARAPVFYANITRKLRAKGMAAAAGTLEGEFGPALGASARRMATGAVPAARLPGKCPQCGGPLRSDEVDWVDAQSAECPYCGSVVHTEG
jgi:ribosomal protein L37AE/L43A